MAFTQPKVTRPYYFKFYNYKLGIKAQGKNVIQSKRKGLNCKFMDPVYLPDDDDDPFTEIHRIQRKKQK